MNAPEIKSAYDLLAIIADPVSTRERLDQIAAATEAARQATEDAKAAQAALDQGRADHQGKLDAAHEAHQARLAQDRVDLEKEFDDRRRDLTRRETALRSGEELLRTDRARLTTEVNDRMAQLDAARSSVESQRARLRR